MVVVHRRGSKFSTCWCRANDKMKSCHHDVEGPMTRWNLVTTTDVPNDKMKSCHHEVDGGGPRDVAES